MYVASQYTLPINFQEGAAEMEEKVPRDLGDLRDQKVIKANQRKSCKHFPVYSVCSVYHSLQRVMLLFYLNLQVMLVELEVLGPRDLLGLKEQWDHKDRGCQVWVTTAGDARTVLEMPLQCTQASREKDMYSELK